MDKRRVPTVSATANSLDLCDVEAPACFVLKNRLEHWFWFGILISKGL